MLSHLLDFKEIMVKPMKLPNLKSIISPDYSHEYDQKIRTLQSDLETSQYNLK